MPLNCPDSQVRGLEGDFFVTVGLLVVVVVDVVVVVVDETTEAPVTTLKNFFKLNGSL